MIYLLALIAVVTIAVLCWKAFGPEKAGRTTPQAHSPRRRRAIGPDDDPEFLWRLSHQQRDGESGPADR
ncbi:hypothetical protein AB0C34_29155 [Nocardia sp. NPDC049220]|uniref:hypothetical protein n=1 Tax=Nocardia sp. NPDC049220 TaxID=3155273 RepID=UPI0033DFE9BB